MKYVLVFLCLMLYQNSIAQDSMSFHFVPLDDNLIDTINISTFDIDQSFKSIYIVLDDSTVIYSDLFCKINKEMCLLKCRKQKTGNWSIFLENKWLTFFDSNQNAIKNISCFNDSLLIFQKNERSFLDENIFAFEMKNNFYFDTSPKKTYLFHPIYGFIGVVTPRTNLIRVDYLTKR